MTDPNAAQGAVLIAALNEQLREMTPKLILAERQAEGRHASGARVMRQVAAELRRDVDHALFLIAQLRRRFPDLDSDHTVLAANGRPDSATASDTASTDQRAHTRWAGNDERRIAAR